MSSVCLSPNDIPPREAKPGPPGVEDGGVLYAFTANEIMDLRRLLLPNRMSRHDTKGEARLRAHVDNIRRDNIRRRRSNKEMRD